jgi:hypothetical protein
VISTQETTGTNISITRARFDDAEGILGCLRVAFEPSRMQYTPAAYEDTVMTTEMVRQRIETMTVLVARNEVGLICRMSSLVSPSSVNPPPTVE